MKQWSNKKLRIVYYGSWLLYYVFILVLPIFSILRNYDLNLNYRISAVAMCIGVAVISFVLLRFKRMLNEAKNSWNKRIGLMVFQLSFLAIGVIILVMFKMNFTIAFRTISQCLMSVGFGIIVENMLVYTIKEHRDLRGKAQENYNVGELMEYVKK